ncbi:hypothetical protein GEV33_001413 [Tenebrio molitor]|uniref:Uncharacterized protein n=1 Tax=Tenebrio molitor TaxID=7067 RepID=A0A8J6LJJ3_TENMO|nr:hypothetical protein GEV33_001414 [Tenebrio molitor]KAH0821378.1 hypothetical protein GEV33_001413 [Tenebrio molitor]
MLLRPLRDITFVNSDDSVSLSTKYHRYIPSGPLPVVPADEEEEDEDRTSDDDLDELLSPYSETSNVSER